MLGNQAKKQNREELEKQAMADMSIPEVSTRMDLTESH